MRKFSVAVAIMAMMLAAAPAFAAGLGGYGGGHPIGSGGGHPSGHGGDRVSGHGHDWHGGDHHHHGWSFFR